MGADKTNKNAKWYVVHTYSGYENKVKTNLEKAIENRNMEELIVDIRVPTEDVVEKKGDEERIVTRKIFPGYVLIKMVKTPETWYIVRNTTGVTGFVGPSSEPIPLTAEEVASLGIEVKEAETIPVEDISVDYAVGDNVRIITGAFADKVGVVDSIDLGARKVNVSVAMFGRKTPLELDITSVESL